MQADGRQSVQLFWSRKSFQLAGRRRPEADWFVAELTTEAETDYHMGV